MGRQLPSVNRQLPSVNRQLPSVHLDNSPKAGVRENKAKNPLIPKKPWALGRIKGAKPNAHYQPCAQTHLAFTRSREWASKCPVRAPCATSVQWSSKMAVDRR